MLQSSAYLRPEGLARSGKDVVGQGKCLSTWSAILSPRRYWGRCPQTSRVYRFRAKIAWTENRGTPQGRSRNPGHCSGAPVAFRCRAAEAGKELWEKMKSRNWTVSRPSNALVLKRARFSSVVPGCGQDSGDGCLLQTGIRSCLGKYPFPRLGRSTLGVFHHRGKKPRKRQRSKAGAQAHRRSPHIHQRGTPERTLAPIAGAGETCRGRLRYERSSTEHRAQFTAPSKKRR